MKVDFKGISSSQEKRFTKLLKPLQRFLPFWANEFGVDLDDTGLTIANAGFDKEYRRMVIFVSNELIAMDDSEVSKVLTHEICHAYNEPILSFFNEVLPGLLNQEQFNMIQPLFTREMESQTEDLAVMLGRLS